MRAGGNSDPVLDISPGFYASWKVLENPVFLSVKFPGPGKS